MSILTKNDENSSMLSHPKQNNLSITNLETSMTDDEDIADKENQNNLVVNHTTDAAV